MVEGERPFVEFQGALTESYVAHQLVAAGNPQLHYWRSSGGKAELDFLCELGGRVVPLEVKAGINRKSKSLRSYDDQFDPDVLSRTNLRNLKQDGKICNIPLYAISALARLLGLVALALVLAQALIVDSSTMILDGTLTYDSVQVRGT